MKKIVAMLLAVLMLVSMTACQAAGDNTNTGDNANKKYVVGICQLITHEALDAATKGFKDALIKEFGDNIEFDEQIAAGDPATCASIANAFVSKNVDLIMANATPALQAAAAATAEIPVLGTSVTEYGVALELKSFNGTVGTNVSGTSDLAPLKDQAAMVKEWFPDAKNIGLLYCSAEPNSQYQVDTVKKELEALGYTCAFYAFADSNDLQSVAQTAADKSDVIYVPTDNAAAAATEIIDAVCQSAGVPIIAGEEGLCKGCGVATLSISYYDLGWATGVMAAKILKGEAKVSEMPIGYAPATKKYNAKICEALKLTVPEGYAAIGE